MATVYEINKGINRSIEFKGIKAQYIMYLAAGLVLLLLAFAILYVIGISIYLCLAIVLPAGAGLYMTVQRLSHKYGEHGLMKKFARKQLPNYLRSKTRKVFIRLSKKKDEEGKIPGRATSHI